MLFRANKVRNSYMCYNIIFPSTTSLITVGTCCEEEWTQNHALIGTGTCVQSLCFNHHRTGCRKVKQLGLRAHQNLPYYSIVRIYTLILYYKPTCCSPKIISHTLFKPTPSSQLSSCGSKPTNSPEQAKNCNTSDHHCSIENSRSY